MGSLSGQLKIVLAVARKFWSRKPWKAIDLLGNPALALALFAWLASNNVTKQQAQLMAKQQANTARSERLIQDSIWNLREQTRNTDDWKLLVRHDSVQWQAWSEQDDESRARQHLTTSLFEALKTLARGSILFHNIQWIRDNPKKAKEPTDTTQYKLQLRDLDPDLKYAFLLCEIFGTRSAPTARRLKIAQMSDDGVPISLLDSLVVDVDADLGVDVRRPQGQSLYDLHQVPTRSKSPFIPNVSIPK